MDVYLLIKKLRWVLILLLVNALTFSVKAFFVFSLLVIDIFLKTFMHFQGRVEPVFYRVVGSAWHILGNQRPLLAVLQEEVHQLLVLVEGPFVASDVGVEVIMPPLPALLSDPTRQHGCNKIPALGPMLNDHELEPLVLLLGPRALLAALDLVLLLEAEVLEVGCLDG